MAPISTPFIAARQAATSTSGRSAEVTSREPGRKCSSMCGTLRAQKVTDFTRRVLISPSLMMVASQMVSHVDRAGRDQIEAPWHCAQHRQRAAFLQLEPGQSSRFLLSTSRRKISDRSGRVLALIVDRGIQFVDDNAGDAGIFWRRQSCYGSVPIRSFSCSGVSVP